MRKLWTLVAVLVAASFIGLNVASAEDAHHGDHHKGGHRKKGDRKHPPIEKIFKKLDTNSDGSLSAKEILAKLDENKDGTVSIKEFAAAMKKIHAKHGGHHKAGHPMGDHRKGGHPMGDHRKMGDRKRPPIKKIFNRLDANSDGSLSVKEIEKSPRIDGEAKAKKILAKWDDNKDGTVNIMEFAAALKKIHAKYGDHRKAGHHGGDHRKKGEHKESEKKHKESEKKE